jgi:hypothetical protein
MVEDGVVGFEDAVGEPVVAHELLNVFRWVQLRAFGWKRDDRDVRRNVKSAGEMPTGLIDQQRRVGARSDLRGDFGQVEVHRLGVATRHDEPCALALLRTDRAEDIGRGGALVLRGARARAALGPAPGDLVLLANARLVGEPDLYALGIEVPLAPDRLQARRETFLKILDRALDLRMMPGAGRELAIAHGAKLPAQRLLGDDDTELLPNPLAKIDDPPPHDPIDRRDRPALNDRRQRRAVLSVQSRFLSWSLSVNQPVGAMGVELDHPVPHDLQRHPADLGGLGAARAFVDLPPRPTNAALAALPSTSWPPPSVNARQSRLEAVSASRTSVVRKP